MAVCSLPFHAAASIVNPASKACPTSAPALTVSTPTVPNAPRRLNRFRRLERCFAASPLKYSFQLESMAIYGDASDGHTPTGLRAAAANPEIAASVDEPSAS